MKEKVLLVKLPEGAEYRRVDVTEDGSIGIVYAEKSEKESISTFSEVIIPKPEKLIGGSEVYQKKGIPYWYCKIKNGRDEFMHLYTEDLVEEDLLYDENGNVRSFSTEEELLFRDNTLKALANKSVEYCRWIPVYEPSFDFVNGLKFVAGEDTLKSFDSVQWEDLFINYSKENESGMFTKTTYFLLLLRWLKDGAAKFEQIVRYSNQLGHYRDSLNAKTKKEKAGERFFGGLYGFVGNTGKIIKDFQPNSKYFIAGGTFLDEGKQNSLSTVKEDFYYYDESSLYVGLLELRK